MLMPVRTSAIKYLTFEQTERFFAAIREPREKAVFALIYHHGLRVTEATLLQLSDVDLCRKRISITRLKNGYGGEWPLMANTAQAIEAYLPVRLQTGTELFTGRQGGLKRQRIQQLFGYYARRAGLDATFSLHCLRHSIATHLLDAGFELKYVQEHLGHVNIQSTLIYAQLTNKRRDAVFRKIEKCKEIVKV